MGFDLLVLVGVQRVDWLLHCESNLFSCMLSIILQVLAGDEFLKLRELGAKQIETGISSDQEGEMVDGVRN